jgi:6-phosphogluconate dehydrogenase
MADDSQNKGTANIGVIGLAAMGAALSRNLARHGNTVAVYNRSAWRTDELIKDHGDEGKFVPSKSLEEFVSTLKRPRTAIIMIKAGQPTEDMIHKLADLFEPGDIIIDGGNTYFKDTMRREKEMAARGIHFVGMGVSGGEQGALLGPSIMPGGPEESWKTLGPILESIAAKAPDGTPCVTHIGENGAGHFVKMVHNGIEYADMQLIAESYDLMRRGLGLEPAQIADIFDEWNKGELNSYLIQITSLLLRHTDAKTGKPFVDIVVDQAEMKGTGTWTVQTALGLPVPVPSIAEAVFARGLSERSEQREEAQKVGMAGPEPHIDLNGKSQSEFIEDIRKALYASKIIAYAQGFDEIAEGARQYGWKIDLAAVARIWRAGCIIRAQFLNRISDAYDSGKKMSSLIFDPYFAKSLADAQSAWRTVVAQAALGGVPAPAFSSSLAYYDGLRSKRLPAALIQAQRDYFGSHTYGRVDMPGVFHTLWATKECNEIQEHHTEYASQLKFTKGEKKN